jgi:hypothetical protein
MKQQRFIGMNRRRLRRAIRYDWLDVLVTAAALIGAVTAVTRWPEKVLADIAIPTAFLIAFMVWRDDNPRPS